MAERALYTARTEDLAVQELGDELLIYDRTWDVAHCLTETAARVWRACEGDGATLDEIAAALVAEGETGGREEPRAIVERALTELEEKGLLAEPSGGVSRRHALRRIAGIGAGALAAPLVVSAAVPRSAEAFKSPSTCGGSGTTCTTASCGTSTSNTCCPPGQKSCPTGTVGGCYCGSNLKCANCVTSGGPIGAGLNCPSACSTQPTCGVLNTANTCCCSGLCSSSMTGNCA